MKEELWEEALLKEHKGLLNKDIFQAKKDYLTIVRQWIYYGSTFFKAKYIPGESVYFKQEFEGKVRVGVNERGLHVIDPKKMVRSQQTNATTNLMDLILCWIVFFFRFFFFLGTKEILHLFMKI